MSQRTEYRVRWKRQGRQASYRIFQRWDSAGRKARGIVALEAVKDDTSFASMPDLEYGPVIEAREVGEWSPVEHAVVHVSDYSKRAMAEWAEATCPRNLNEAWGNDAF